MLDNFQSLDISLEASFQVHRAPFFRPKCLTLRGPPIYDELLLSWLCDRRQGGYMTLDG